MDINYKDYESDTLKFVEGDKVVKTFNVQVGGTVVGSTGEFEQIPLDQLEKIGEQCSRAIFGEKEHK